MEFAGSRSNFLIFEEEKESIAVNNFLFPTSIEGIFKRSNRAK